VKRAAQRQPEVDLEDVPVRTGPGLGAALVLPLAFLALALLWGQVGYLTPSVSRPLGGILWLAAVALAAREKKILWVLASALLLFNPWGAVQQQAGLWLLGLFPWAGGRWGRRWMGAAWLAALGGFAWHHLPGLWPRLDLWTSQNAATLSQANLSAAAAGLPLAALALCFPLAALLSERRLLPAFSTAGLVALATLIYWGLQRKLESSLHQYGFHGQHDAFSLQWVLLILLALVLVLWAVFDPPPARPPRRRAGWLIPALAVVGAVLAGWAPRVGSPDPSRLVVFYDKGYMDWNTPVYGRYGQHSSGMFGLAPQYLQWRGLQTTRRDALTPELLDSAGVVVVINLQEDLGKPEEQALRRWIEAGGTLILLGDHTGLAGIREPLNRLSSPYGITLNFDSAKPTRNGWGGSMAAAPHPMAAGLGINRLAPPGREGITQVWIGASLTVQSPARPLLVGREGFSDQGNPENEKDGYLGDFRYLVNERLGNLPLAAEAAVGRGKVLVFGDTSTLQNGSLVRAGEFVRRLFYYALAPSRPAPEALKLAGVLLLAGAALAWALSGSTYLGLALGSLALFAGSLAVQARLEAALRLPAAAWSAEAPPRALLDHSHRPRLTFNQVSDDGSWGLQNCLLRSGFLPVVLETWDEAAVRDARVLVEVAPARSFRAGETATVRAFMEGGGLVILTCGTEECDGSRSLLADFGLQPVYTPLGPAEVDTVLVLPAENDSLAGDQSHPVKVQFHEAWGVQSANPAARVLLEGYGRPLALFAPAGRGGLLYLPDTDFLTNRNLESPSRDPREGNILFLRYLLRELAGGK